MTELTSEQSIFLNAIGLTAGADRGAYLDEACRSDPRLRDALGALLAAHDRLGGVAPPGPGPAAPAAGAVLGGRYELLEEVGEGGMGTVWMAQQVEPVRRSVAVKLIKAGMDSKAVLARFEQERQALALMDHPNIATVLDAGAAPDGRPFFVMELVKGVPITRYCDERHLTPRQRLELFIPVCQAIQHAHQKGIIHRDVKPSNVMITLYDGKAVPKVIDFGVAKAIEQKLTERTLHTGIGAVVGTPEYMSPEQAGFNNLDVDTRSDVYSLGTLLYELLTGGPPFSRKELEEAGLVGMLRVIREREPPKPSTKLSTAEGLPAVAANRGTEPGKLARLVRGELDWIVMKALEKDRNRRYATANDLVADVRRYLTDEPVHARPPSAGYRLRKWARRHAAVVWAAGVVTAAVFLTLALVTWQWRVAVRAVEDKEEARVAEQQQREAAEAHWAAALIALADRDWVRGELGQARRTLSQCPAKYRDGQWRQLHLACHAEVAALPVPVDVGPAVPHFTPSGGGFLLIGAKQVTAYEGEAYRARALCEMPVSSWTRAIGADGEVHTANSWFGVVGANGAALTLTFVCSSQTRKGLQPAGWEHWAGVWEPRAQRWLSRVALGATRTRRMGGQVLSPDGRLVAFGEEKEVKVRAVAGGAVVGTLPIPEAILDGFSPDGRQLVSRLSGEVRIWEVATGALRHRFAAPGRLTFSPDGAYQVCLVPTRPGTREMKEAWVIQGGQITARLTLEGAVDCHAFAKEGRFLALGRPGGLIELWDIRRSRLVLSLRGHTPSKSLSALRFSPEGQRLVSVSSDRVIKVWDLRAVYESLGP